MPKAAEKLLKSQIESRHERQVWSHPPVCECRFTLRINIPRGTKWFEKGNSLGVWPDRGQIWVCLVCHELFLQPNVCETDVQEAEPSEADTPDLLLSEGGSTMTVSQLIQGLEIIRLHDPDGEVAVDYDVIYASNTETITEESPAGAELAALGWDVDEESWQHFV